MFNHYLECTTFYLSIALNDKLALSLQVSRYLFISEKLVEICLDNRLLNLLCTAVIILVVIFIVHFFLKNNKWKLLRIHKLIPLLKKAC